MSDSSLSASGAEPLPAAPTNSRPTGAVLIQGAAQVGHWLSASHTLSDPNFIPATGSGAISYQWRANGAAIAGATGASYRLTEADLGKRITVTASYTDAGGTAERVNSATTAAVAAAIDYASFVALPRLRIKTSLGDLVIELESDRAPITVANFQRYVDSNFYYGTEFHRILSTFMAQGGGYDYTGGAYVYKTPTYSAITLEKTSSTGLSNLAGTLAMARTSAANSATSQFFVNFVDNTFLDSARASDGNGYAVFGRVVDGGSTLAQLKQVAVVNNGSGEISQPTSAISLLDIVAEPAAATALPTGKVRISGTPVQGQTLLALSTLADADGIPGAGLTGALSYYWKADGVIIPGALAQSLTLTSSMAGKTLTAEVSYTDLKGASGHVGSASVVVGNLNDLPSGRVSLSGTVAAGSTLTASQNLADLDGMPAASAIGWQWKANGSPIAGANASSYTLSAADLGKSITATASYTDLRGTAESVTSAAAGTVDSLMVYPALPRVWLRTNYGDILLELEAQKAPITVANFVRYVTDGFYTNTVFHRIISGFMAQGGGYTITSNQYTSKAATYPAIDLEKTSITGLSNVAGTIAMARSSLPKSATSEFFLNFNDNLFLDAAQQPDGNGYAVFGRTVDGMATLGLLSQIPVANNGAGEVSLPTVATVLYGAYYDAAAPAGQVLITGSAAQGQTLVASNNLVDPDGSLSVLFYQWKANGVAIAGATGSSFTLGQAQAGKAITVAAVYQDGKSAFGYVTSGATATVANLNDQPTGEITISGQAEQGRTLTASHTLADLDGIPSSGANAIRYQWSADGVAIDAATGSSLKLSAALAGKSLSVSASYTDNAGNAQSVSSTATPPVLSAAVTGDVYHWKSHALMSGVTVALQAPGSAADTPPLAVARSGIDGAWAAEGLDFDALYQLSASRTANASECAQAITSADALAALKLVMGRSVNADTDGPGALAPLPASPYQLLAADVNLDGQVTTQDAQDILAMAVGKTGARAPVWRFIDESQPLWNSATGASSVTAAAVPQSFARPQAQAGAGESHHWVAVLVGDVDGSWTPVDSGTVSTAGYDQLKSDYFRALGLEGSALAQWGLLA